MFQRMFIQDSALLAQIILPHFGKMEASDILSKSELLNVFLFYPDCVLLVPGQIYVQKHSS